MAGVSIRVDVSDYERLRVEVADWGGELDRQLRAELGSAAKATARQARQNALRLRLSGLPPGRYPHAHRSTGLRSDIARSVDVGDAAGNGGGKVEFRLHADHPMAVPTNGTHFRHPVFGDRDTWVSQASQPWWTRAIRDGRPDMQRGADQALDRAVRRLSH